MRIGLAGVGRIGAVHAATLASLDEVTELLVTDADATVGRACADTLGVGFVPDVDRLLESDLDGFVIAAATPAHAPLLRAGMDAGVPTFCEKPVAADLTESLALVEHERRSGTCVQIGFQRRFDHGHVRIRDAIAAGELGVVHTLRSNTHDRLPPPAGYIATSGGIFRDCAVHDFDAIRFVTGREVVAAYATGGNKGAAFFAEAGDVATGGALLTLDDDTVAAVSVARYNGAGYDVRLEALGSEASLVAGLDDTLAARSAEPEQTFPAGPARHTFVERFAQAYGDELRSFLQSARGERPSACTIADATAALRIAEACDRSLRERRVVSLSEVPTA